MQNPNVLIIANHTSRELNLLTQNSCIALLPVAGKPLIEHTLEAVSKISAASITIVAARGLGVLRNYIGSGEKWGLLVNVISSRPNETIKTLQFNQSSLFTNDLLVIDCNCLNDYPLQLFLDCVEQKKVSLNLAEQPAIFQATADGAAGGVQLLHKIPIDTTRNTTENTTQNTTQKTTESTTQITSRNFKVASVEVEPGPSYVIKTFEQYHRTNMVAASGVLKNITLRGKERSLGLRTGFMTRVHPKSLLLGKTQIGNNCQIASSCTFKGNNVINSGVVIDRNTSIENSLILDHTFVGENLELKNAILSGNLFIRVDTGVAIEITDRFLTAKLGESLYDTHFADITNRLVGILLTIITVPVWPMAMLIALWSSPTKPIQRKQYLGNKEGKHESGKKPFWSFQFNTPMVTVRNLPLVMAIANGDIRLVGLSLCTPDELANRTDSWETVRDSVPSGVLGATQLYLGANASLDERMLNDSIYHRHSSVYNSLSICWQSLLVLFGIKRSEQAEFVG